MLVLDDALLELCEEDSEASSVIAGPEGTRETCHDGYERVVRTGKGFSGGSGLESRQSQILSGAVVVAVIVVVGVVAKEGWRVLIAEELTVMAVLVVAMAARWS